MIPLYDKNPTQRSPVITRLLIFTNIFVFLVTWWLENRGVHWIASGYGMVPSRLTVDPSGEAGKLISSTFLHASGAHLGWNMLFLQIFGDNIEDALGRARYVLFYLAAGMVAGISQYLVDPMGTTPMIGASGAIAGVLGGYMVLFPNARVIIFNPLLLPLPLLPLPAWLVAGWWFVTNLFGGLISFLGAGSNVAYMAHLGGFAAGLLLIRALRPAGSAPEATDTRQVQRKVFRRSSDGPFWRQ